MAKKRPPLNTWKDIERCHVERFDIVFEGSTVVGIHNSNICDVITEIDVLCRKLQEYKNELNLYYGEIKPKTKSRFYTYIYIAKNKSTNKYKIGRSIDPKHREKILQSSGFDIEFIFVSQATNNEVEKKLHNKFKDKRLKGEWFDLNSEDIKYITQYNYSPK